MNNIKNTFVSFGTAIKNKAIEVRDAMSWVGNELQEATVQMRPALDAAVAQAQAAADDAGRARPLAAVIHAYKAVEYLVFRGKDGQGSVLEEMVEAFGEIKQAFVDLKYKFAGFGNTIKNKSTDVGNQVKSSFDNIATKTKQFSNSIVDMGTDLKTDLEAIPTPAETPTEPTTKEPTTEPKPDQAPIWEFPKNR